MAASRTSEKVGLSRTSAFGSIRDLTIRALPLEERRARLLSLLGEAQPEGICFSEHHDGDGEALYRAACGAGLAGIVAKRKGSRHASGRSKAWLKIKNPEFRRRLDSH